ncbi:MAG: DUF2911 domain-containing protein [Gemmatimonadales bacterium]
MLAPLTVMLLLPAALLLLPAGAARAQRGTRDSAAYVTRLGKDTIAIERVISTRDSIIGEVVDRYPKTERFTYAAHLTPAHEIAGYTINFYRGPAADGTVAATMHVDFRSDTAHMTVYRGDRSQTSAVAVPPSAVPMNEPSYGILQAVVDRALAARGNRVGFSAVYLPGLLIKGSAEADARDDTVRIDTKYDPVRAVVDRQGHIQSFTDVGGTMQAIVTRTPWPDLAHWTADFVARDAKGASLGSLSPRGSARATIGDATLSVDYGRPMKRGRDVFGGVVLWDHVWRTGANAATGFVTDKDIMVGDTRIPAGSYTLFSLPSRTGWKLIVSKRTGEWGTEYDSAADFARIPMRVSRTPNPVEQFTIGIAPAGSSVGVMTFTWDTTVGTLPVRPLSRSGS